MVKYHPSNSLLIGSDDCCFRIMDLKTDEI